MVLRLRRKTSSFFLRISDDLFHSIYIRSHIIMVSQIKEWCGSCCESLVENSSAEFISGLEGGVVGGLWSAAISSSYVLGELWVSKDSLGVVVNGEFPPSNESRMEFVITI